MTTVPVPEDAQRPVAMHPRAGAHSSEVDWVIPPEVLPVRGIVTSAPGALGALLADGTLTEIRAEHGCVVTRARSRQDWQRIGAAVRSALTAALQEPSGWRTTLADSNSFDARIAAAARRLLDGDVGAYARGHSGEITLVSVRDKVAAIRLRGACRGCPASETTLRVVFEDRLRKQCPDLAGVREMP